MRISRAHCLAGLMLLALGCGGERPAQGSGSSSGSEKPALTGAGATFPNPIYTKWFDAYAKETGVRINYQSIGSGGGIRQFRRARWISAPPMDR